MSEPTTRCTAHSKQTGAQCKNPAIPGGTVCRFHGGAAPQVIFKSAVNLEEQRQRLMEHIPTSVSVLGALLHSEDDSVALRAAQLLQERFYGKAQDRVQVSGDSEQPLEIIISRSSTPDPPLT